MFFFLTLSSSAIFGFDYGEDSIKVSTASEKHLIHWAMNSLSKRFNPHIFSLWEPENPTKETRNFNMSSFNKYDWTFGDHAKSRCMKYPEQCINGTPLFKQEVYGTSDVETFAATEIRSVFDSVYQAEGLNDSVQTVFAIPSSFRTKEKVQLLKSLAMSNIDATQFVPQHVATAELYALERTSLFSGSERNVAFLDIGAKGTRVSVFTFSTPNKIITIRERAFVSDEEIGGNHVDKLIFNEMMKSERIYLKRQRDSVSLMADIRKAKEMLTLHEETTILYDNGVDLEQKQYKLSREKLEKICQGYMNKIAEMIQLALKEAGVAADSIELVGGSTRLPFIANLATKAFNVEKVSHSVDADSSVCSGAGYFAAQRSYEFSMKRIDCIFYVRDEFIVKINGNEYVLFGKDSTYDSIATVKEVMSSDDVVEVQGSDHYPIYNFTVKNLNKREEVELSFVYGYFMLPMPYNAFVYTSGRPVVHEIQRSVDLIHSDGFDFLINESLSRRENEKARNDFEAELFRVKKYISLFQKDSDAARVYKEAEEWYDNVPSNTTTQEYIDALEKLQLGTIHEIKEYVDQENRIKELEKLKEKITKISATLSEAVSENRVNQTSADLIQAKVQEISKWLSSISEETVDAKLINEKRNEIKSIWRKYKAELRGITFTNRKKQRNSKSAKPLSI